MPGLEIGVAGKTEAVDPVGLREPRVHGGRVVPSVLPVATREVVLSKQGKSKNMMSREAKQSALARKQPRTLARKKAKAVAQEIAATRNRISPAGAPWALAKARRAAIRHGVSGAA